MDSKLDEHLMRLSVFLVFLATPLPGLGVPMAFCL